MGLAWQIVFPLVFLLLQCPKFSFPAPLVSEILNMLLLAQHSGSSHNDLYFNTKMKYCVP